jgi:hypothetical protein
LKAWANLMIDGKNAFEFLTVSITNRGKFSLRIPSAFFYWKVPLKRGVIMIFPLDFYGTALIEKRSYPIEVAPRASETFLISDGTVFKQDVKRFRVDTIAHRLRFRFIRAFVVTDDGETFRVKLSSEVRKVWSVG